MRDDEINQAIDRAVREMLDVEPQADLRARVVARIDRHAGPMRRWPVGLFGTLAAAVMIVVSLMFWGSPRRAAEPSVQVVRREPAARPGAPALRDQATRSTRERDIAHVEPTRRRSRVRVAVATTVGSSETNEIAPLEPIAPIRVAAVASADITPRPMAIEPLAPIAAVEIAPLTPPEGRH